MLLFLALAALAVLADSWDEPSGDRFGADVGAEPPIARIKRRLLALDRAATAPALEAVARLDRDVERNVRSIVRQAPATIVGRIRDVVVEAAKRGGDPGAVLGLPALEPETTEEAAEALGAVERALAKSPEVRRIADRAIAELERMDLLGGGDLSTITSLLAAALGGTVVALRTIAGAPIVLRGPGFQISASRSGEFAAKLKLKNPLWARQSVELALAGDASPGAGRVVSSASARVPIVVVDRPRTKVTLAPYVELSEAERRAGAEATVRFG